MSPITNTDFELLQPICDLLANINVPWWIAGGWAIDLATGAVSREHHDVDVMLLERDEHALRSAVTDATFELVVGPDEHVEPWLPDRRLLAGPDRIRVRSSSLPVATEIIFGAAVGRTWVFHRGQAGMTRPLDQVTRWRGDIPYLAPEVVLAMKSLHSRPQDEMDFCTAAPILEADQRQWLTGVITQRWLSARRRAGDLTSDGTDHPWVQRLLVDAGPSA